MRALWVGIHPRSEETRLLAMAGAAETVLKARLSRPHHPRALAWLLESLALWEGAPVRAALAVDVSVEQSDGVFFEPLDSVGGSPLFELEFVPSRRPRRERERDRLEGSFRDLRQLLLFKVAR